MMKKAVILLLCLCIGVMLYPMVWAGASPVNDLSKSNGDYRYYVLNDIYISLIQYIGTDRVIAIPPEIEQKKVIKIGKNCFSNNEGVTKVVIPDGVTYIDDGAFAGCRKLESLTIPDSVQYIGYGAFNASGIRTFRMPKGIQVQDHALVEACPNLRRIILTGLQELDSEDINIMNRSCPKLKEFKIEGKNGSFFVIDGVLFQKSKQKKADFSGEEVVSLVAYPQGKKGKTYRVPLGVSEIKGSAFRECKNLEKIILPKDVKRMRMELSSKQTVTLVVLNRNMKLSASEDYNSNMAYFAYSKLSIQAWGASTAINFAELYNIPYTVMNSFAMEEDEWESVEEYLDTDQAEVEYTTFSEWMDGGRDTEEASDSETDVESGETANHIRQNREVVTEDGESVAVNVTLDEDTVDESTKRQISKNQYHDVTVGGDSVEEPAGSRTKGDADSGMVELFNIAVPVLTAISILTALLLPRKIKEKREKKNLMFSREGAKG